MMQQKHRQVQEALRGCCCSKSCLIVHLQGLDWDIGAIGTATWSGVRLRDVLTAAGRQAGSRTDSTWCAVASWPRIWDCLHACVARKQTAVKMECVYLLLRQAWILMIHLCPTSTSLVLIATLCLVGGIISLPASSSTTCLPMAAAAPALTRCSDTHIRDGLLLLVSR